MPRLVAAFVALLASFAPVCRAQTGANVLLIVNAGSQISQEIGEYYQRRRKVPKENLCRIRTVEKETIDRATYEALEGAVRACLDAHPEPQRILYLVTAKGVPLRIEGTAGGKESDAAAVDSELALLYAKRQGDAFAAAGPVNNPFFGQYLLPFDLAKYRFYPTTRLTGYTLSDVRGLIDRSLAARNTGLFVFDLTPGKDGGGDQWMKVAMRALPGDRVKAETTPAVQYDVKNVIGYASWGSNDGQRAADHRRDPSFTWLPGGIATEYVSTDGRTFREPPADWRITTWADKTAYFDGSPQSLTGDFIRQGATGASGHVYEPYLAGTPHPNYLFPAYYGGRNLAESFYLSIPFLSWMNVVVGDPLCSLGKPE